MPQSNIILNGTFDAGNANWSGTDLETNFPESAYLGNGSSNRVAEIDGNSGQTTIMEQTFKVGSSHATTLTFDVALRTASNGNAGTEGFRVDIVDANGSVIATQTYFPLGNSFSGVTLPVNFPGGGVYRLRFTELGPDDSLGAIVDNVSILVCFTAGTMIATDTGARAIETLNVGDKVWTLDDGFVPVTWINRRKVALADQIADPRLCPVVFAPGSLGEGLPARELVVSPQHRMLVNDWRAELNFGAPEVLVPAASLINGTSISVATPRIGLTYVHFLLDRHQVILANGALSESFFPSKTSLRGIEAAAQAELFRLFPALRAAPAAYGQTARPVVRYQDARLLA